ncbi:hypothetical protein LTR94_002351 [Friedmanniomyces endolithicus]|nr:hypothetical protein LTR94_002351 [Friedmanniomyces endolithicus]
MKLSKILTAAALVVAPMYVAPVSAQTAEQWEQMDAEYEACKARFIRDGFGDDNLASQWCYPRIYGSEGNPPTGEDFDPSGYYPGGNQCYGSFRPPYCNPPYNQP